MSFRDRCGRGRVDGRTGVLRVLFLTLVLCSMSVGLTACASSGGAAPAKDRSAPRNSATRARAADAGDDEPGLIMRILGRGRGKAPPEPTELEEVGLSRPKKLTVPKDTVNALRLMAQDWVLAARERPPSVRRTPNGTYVREYNTFDDQYTLEIERAEEQSPDGEPGDGATLVGYVFLDSEHLRTAEHPTADAAEADTEYRRQPRKLRMTFRLLERWEFSTLSEEFVFNRVWELSRVQYKPIMPAAPAPASTVPAVKAPEATPRAQ